MSWYEDRILPYVVDRACGTAELRAWRRRAVDGLSGVVLEIGFGSGSNLAVLGPGVEVLHAVEPSAVARRLAEPRIAASGIRVDHVALDGTSIPLDDASCDAALSTFTLCTIPDVGAALGEVARILGPGGSLHFLEHGCSPDPRVARWQRRLDPLQQRLAGGCHLTRSPVALIEAAGFEIVHAESGYARGPRPWTWLTVGRAVNRRAAPASRRSRPAER